METKNIQKAKRRVVSLTYAMNLLGIDIKRLKKCTIEFDIDDLVRITTEHLLKKPTEEAQTSIKRFYLTKKVEENHEIQEQL